MDEDAAQRVVGLICDDGLLLAGDLAAGVLWLGLLMMAYQGQNFVARMKLGTRR